MKTLHYAGTLDGGRGIASLTMINKETYKLSLEVKGYTLNDGGGQIDAIAHRKSHDILIVTKGLEGPPCHLSLTEKGPKLIIKEGNCLYYHGASSSFDGILLRVYRE